MPTSLHVGTPERLVGTPSGYEGYAPSLSAAYALGFVLAIGFALAGWVLHVRALFSAACIVFIILAVYGRQRVNTLGVYGTGERVIVRNPWSTVKLPWRELVAIDADERGVYLASRASKVYPEVLERHDRWKSFDPASLDHGIEKLRAEAARHGALLRDSVDR